MAGGFVADPRGDFHLEIAVTGDQYADDIVNLAEHEGCQARLNHRRGMFAIYFKSFDDVVTLLRAMGAQRSALAVVNVRRVKSLKNDVNRRVNAEMANNRRTTHAAGSQQVLIDQVEEQVGFEVLPPALREFCLLRREHPELSLAELGMLCKPRASKSAMYHRVLRLQRMVEASEKQG